MEGTLISILVVAEKPSVAMSYAKVLGATNRQDGYLEGNDYLVSWCIGHLVELAPPNVYDAKYVKWSIADLPILPQKWQYLVSASTKKQFGILQKLMNRPDVDSIVNSCDSGREGELIFRLVYQQAGCKKPVSRLWLSSMEENAIREGFAHLKPSTEYDALYNAALCRERADWMVGMRIIRIIVSEQHFIGKAMHILDEIIDKMVRQIFSRLRGIPKEQLITSRYAKETAERKNHLQALQAERDKAEKDLLALKTEILAVIKGESAFPKDTLAEMIAAQEKKHTELDTLCEEASAELERNAELMANVSQLYEELISYADLYDSASFEAKKMIVSQLIRRVEVYRGYQIHVDFNFDLAQYLENSDELAC